jgi:tripartite ATP-independent transporter DctM subunit
MRDLLAGTGHQHPRESPVAGLLGRLHAAENLFLALALGAMAVLPIAESLLRAAFGVGIPASSAWVQHLVLFVAMLGAAVAAREGRLLALSTGSALLSGWRKSAAAVFSGAFASAITALLCVASVRFVLAEKLGGNLLAAGVPLWTVEAILPVGFGLVAIRLVLRSGAGWPGRSLTALTAGVIVLLGVWPPLPAPQMAFGALLGLLLATVLGAPVFAVLGGAAVIFFWGEGVPIAAIPVEMYSMVVSPALPTIPLFTMAGYFLAEGGASRRLVRVFQALAGWIPGGPAIVTVLACAFFTSFTGASGVTILALGGLLMPVLLAARYSERDSLGLLTAAGSLGLLFPPSLPVILYGIVSHVPIDRMFLGGILPGVLMLGLAGWWGSRRGARAGVLRRPFEAREAVRALWAAKWELLLPVVVVVGLYGGFATLVETAALTALYAFVVETFVYRDLRVRRDLPRVMSQCGLLVGGVLIILGVALGFTNYLIDAQIPAQAVSWVKGSVTSPLVFLLLLNLFLLVVGCLMDIFSAIVVVVPLITPMGEAFGIDPIHLGIIFLANMELGYLTPPVGMNLFLSSYRFGKPLPEVYRSVVPMLLVLLAGVILITYVPALTLAIPRWLGRS